MPQSMRTPAAALSALAVLVAAATLPSASARAEGQDAYLAGIHRHITLTTTVPDNGDQNPYAIVVAPVSAGKVQKDDVLIDNFNNLSNLQGLGTTIVDYNPSTKKTTLFASLPRHLPACPGGVGLTTAMTMLKSGWVIVGSTPSNDGTTSTKGDGCLLVLDANGQLVSTLAGSEINGPWGNMAVIDNGTTAKVFVSMAGFDVPSPDVRDSATGFPVTVSKATVLRIDFSIPEGKPPVVTGKTVVANGFGQRADRDVFMIGPTGLALSPDNATLYISDALGNRIVAIADAATRTNSAGTGRDVSKDGMLKRPLALVMTPNGHLLACNSKNGQVVEIDPATGKQLGAQWIDANQAQNPPGSGDLFGIAMTPDGKGFYYVEDEINGLVLAR